MVPSSGEPAEPPEPLESPEPPPSRPSSVMRALTGARLSLGPMGCSKGPEYTEVSYEIRTELTPRPRSALAAASASARRPSRSRVGSPPPRRVSRFPSGVAVTVVAMRWPGPSAESPAAIVASFTVEAGVMGRPACDPYSVRPVAASITTPPAVGPSAGSSIRWPSALPSPLPVGAALLPSAGSTPGALGAGAGPAACPGLP